MNERQLRYGAQITSFVASLVVIGKSLLHLFTMLFWGMAWSGGTYWPLPYIGWARDLPMMATDSSTMEMMTTNASGAGVDAMPIAPEMMPYYDPYAFLQLFQQVIVLTTLFIVIAGGLFLLYQSLQIQKKPKKWHVWLFLLSAAVAFIGNYWLIGLLYFISGAFIGFAFHHADELKGEGLDENNL